MSARQPAVSRVSVTVIDMRVLRGLRLVFTGRFNNLYQVSWLPYGELNLGYVEKIFSDVVKECDGLVKNSELKALKARVADYIVYTVAKRGDAVSSELLIWAQKHSSRL